MKNFLIGLGIGILGVLLWLITSVLVGIGEGTGVAAPPVCYVFMVIGFVVMFLAPLTFWIILPIKRMLSRHTQMSLTKKV